MNRDPIDYRDHGADPRRRMCPECGHLHQLRQRCDICEKRCDRRTNR